MPNKTIEEILQKIDQKKPFEAESEYGSFYIKIEEYTPFICTAIHNGHRLREDLSEICLLSEQERWYEEDPNTLDFISSFPIVMGGLDSRYEYDLNRPPDIAVYETAWGKDVWKRPLTADEKNTSLAKHENFYRVLYHLIEILEKSFGAVLLFDIHSYNFKRIDRETPLFNLGTENINIDEYAPYIQHWEQELNRIQFPGENSVVRQNDVFGGHGHLLKSVGEKFNNTLVFATEIKKVYCNEETGELYFAIVESLSTQLKKAIINSAAFFAKRKTHLTVVKKNSLLSSELDHGLLNLDRSLFEITKNIEILSYINPVNVETARKDFFKNKYKVNPDFYYNQLSINPFEFKRLLYNLPVEQISDISIRILYQDIIDSYADKIGILSSIGEESFLYNSLRYFGEPDPVDIGNAEYILHCSSSMDLDDGPLVDSSAALEYFEQVAENYHIQCKIELSRKIVSKVLVLNNKKMIRIRKDAKFSPVLLRALGEHEIGVHMLTTINARLQPLHIFRLGLPLNTHTQEGLAILSEYLSGQFRMGRMQILALRTLAIDHMLKGYDFKDTFAYLMDQHTMDEDQAFYIAARVFRGGGFTKDYLYLRGFRDIYKLYKNNVDLIPLLIGKTNVRYSGIINEMLDRKLITPPRHKTASFLKPAPGDAVIDYILEGLQ